MAGFILDTGRILPEDSSKVDRTVLALKMKTNLGAAFMTIHCPSIGSAQSIIFCPCGWFQLISVPPPPLWKNNSSSQRPHVFHDKMC